MNFKLLISLISFPNKFKKLDGFDTRYHFNDNNINQLERINNYFEIKKIINTLENNNTSQYYKLLLIKQNDFLFEDSFTPNITKGGLFDDFNFSID